MGNILKRQKVEADIPGEIPHFSFSTYVEGLRSPIAFFTVHGDFTPYTMYMAYFKNLWLHHPENNAHSFRDLLVECLVVHGYFIAEGYRFIQQAKDGWMSHYSPSVRGRAKQHEADPTLASAIDHCIVQWLHQTDTALYNALAAARNKNVTVHDYLLRALSLILAHGLVILIVFSVKYALTSLAPAFILPSLIVMSLFGYAMSQAFNPLLKEADLLFSQCPLVNHFLKTLDNSVEVFESKRSVVDDFPQSTLAHDINESFAETIISLRYPDKNMYTPERESSKKTLLFLAHELLVQRYAKKYQYHSDYLSRNEEQRLLDTGAGPPCLDVKAMSARY